MKVELNHIHKRFGAVHANDNITLVVPEGTIQGILGENGAGKSTLMKILSGFIRMDAGEILLDGRPVHIASPAGAIHHGIGMLHQDPLDFPPMRVIDNFLIGSHTRGLIPDRVTALGEFNALQKKFDFDIDPNSYVDMLTVGERQQLEILRLLWLGAKVLILDEPTTGISALQKEKLFETLRTLASEMALTVIFVSHKLEEVEGLCDQVAVLARGRLVGQVCPPYLTDELVRLMFGRPVALGGRETSRKNETVLQLSKICIEDYRLNIQNVNLQVSKGEVIGLAGMEGSGQRQFLQVCGGLMRPVGGTIKVNGRSLAGKPYLNFMHSGIGYLPAARLEEGLISGLTLAEHVTLTGAQQGFFIDHEMSQRVTQRHINEFFIHGTASSQIEALSGGNQQRTLLALLPSSLNLLLMEHPTRGLDIESSIWMWSKFKERCKQGTAILFISSDLDEILHYSDRILVFFGGKVSKPIGAATTSVEDLGQLIGGKGW